MTGTHMMMLAGGSTIQKSGDAAGNVFLNEPAPATQTVGTNSVTISGRNLTSCTWSHISGDSFTISAPGNGLNASWQTVNQPKNTTRSGVYRASGNNGLAIDVAVETTYTTDL